MEVQKTVTCCIFQPTKKKLSLLDEVYAAWRDMIKQKRSYRENRLKYPKLHSKYAWNALRARPNDPLYLDTQHQFDIIKTKNKTRYFARITIRRGFRIFCPLKTKLSLEGYVIHDSKLLKRDGHYEFHLVISKDVTLESNPSSVLSVDLGEKVIATAVLLHPSHNSNEPPLFMGRSVRGLRRHYAYIRKKLGQKKLLHVIRKIEHTESRRVNDILHKISKDIVRIAKENNSVILVGDLTGIRKIVRGKRMNRIVAHMPYYKLSQYITYKANWEGIPVLTTKEGILPKHVVDAILTILVGHIGAFSNAATVVTSAMLITTGQKT